MKNLMGCRTILIGIVIIIAISVALFWRAYPSYSWNQKVTMTVQTPDGIVSASSVGRMVVSEKVSLGIAEAGGINSDFEGEATIVALPNGQFLFALIQSANSFSLKVFSDVPGVRKSVDGSYVQWDESAKHIQNLVGARTFPAEYYPMLVTFADINDPASVKEVDPANLAVTFGLGYSLKSITLEITDEDVTLGEAKKVLRWLDSIKNTQLDGDRYRRSNAQNQVANSLNILDIIRKIK